MAPIADNNSMRCILIKGRSPAHSSLPPFDFAQVSVATLAEGDSPGTPQVAQVLPNRTRMQPKYSHVLSTWHLSRGRASCR